MMYFGYLTFNVQYHTVDAFSGSFLFDNDKASGCYGGILNLKTVSVPPAGWTYIRR